MPDAETTERGQVCYIKSGLGLPPLYLYALTDMFLSIPLYSHYLALLETQKKASNKCFLNKLKQSIAYLDEVVSCSSLSLVSPSSLRATKRR